MFHGTRPNLLMIGSLILAVSFALAIIWRTQSVQAQSQTTDWEKAVRGKMSFDIASVKQDSVPLGPNTQHSNIDLSSEPGFAPTGGRFSVSNYSFTSYLTFAYKLRADQLIALNRQLPKWALSSRYDIEARAEGNPTKDQYRLMMQSLLADRFKLVLHFETKPTSVLTLMVNKPGKLGPQLRQHDPTVPCTLADATTFFNPQTIAAGFPQSCGQVSMLPPGGGYFRLGARGISMQILANYLSAQPLIGLTRPVVDGTRLAGDFDFTIYFTPSENQASNLPFEDALKDQMGLKLQAGQTAEVDTPVLDHIEEPTPN